MLANWNTTGDKDRFLLQARQPMPVPEGGQLLLDLPELTPKGLASWLLDLFNRASGQSIRQGRGAPWDMRLFVGALLHLPIAQRDGQWHPLSLPTEEIIGWLYPDGWHNQRRDWQRLLDALFRMNRELGFVEIEGLGYVQVVGAIIVPKKPTDPVVSSPPGSLRPRPMVQDSIGSACASTGKCPPCSIGRTWPLWTSCTCLLSRAKRSSRP